MLCIIYNRPLLEEEIKYEATLDMISSNDIGVIFIFFYKYCMRRILQQKLLYRKLSLLKDQSLDLQKIIRLFSVLFAISTLQ